MDRFCDDTQRIYPAAYRKQRAWTETTRFPPVLGCLDTAWKERLRLAWSTLGRRIGREWEELLVLSRADVVIFCPIRFRPTSNLDDKRGDFLLGAPDLAIRGTLAALSFLPYFFLLILLDTTDSNLCCPNRVCCHPSSPYSRRPSNMPEFRRD